MDPKHGLGSSSFPTASLTVTRSFGFVSERGLRRDFQTDSVVAQIVFEPPRPIELKAQGSVSKLKPGYPLLYDGGGIGGTVDDSRLARLRRKLTKLRNKT